MRKDIIQRKVHTLLHTPRIMMKKFESNPFFSLLPDRTALKILYRNRFLRKLNLKNPQTFNEKLQWRKLYDRLPLYTIIVDKYAVKDYVESKIGKQYIIPTYGVWDHFDEINFSSLPEQFVLKCTHGSGDTVICRNKTTFDLKYAREKLNKSLQTDYYKISREWPYKNVPRKIIAEKYLVDESGYELKDYKFFCFNGIPKALFVATDRNKQGEEVKFDFFNMAWEHLPLINGHPNANRFISKPASFEKMVEIAKILSDGIPHVRVDLYSVNDQVYIGELTLAHFSGLVKFQPEDWDYTFGSWLQLPGIE